MVKELYANRLAINLAGLKMKTPVTTASGTFGFGLEFTDFLDLEKDGKQAVCPMKLRMVRFLLDTGEYECIVTNLKREEFPPWRIRELYHLRGGICAFLSPIH